MRDKLNEVEQQHLFWICLVAIVALWGLYIAISSIGITIVFSFDCLSFNLFRANLAWLPLGILLGGLIGLIQGLQVTKKIPLGESSEKVLYSIVILSLLTLFLTLSTSFIFTQDESYPINHTPELFKYSDSQELVEDTLSSKNKELKSKVNIKDGKIFHPGSKDVWKRLTVDEQHSIVFSEKMTLSVQATKDSIVVNDDATFGIIFQPSEQSYYYYLLVWSDDYNHSGKCSLGMSDLKGLIKPAWRNCDVKGYDDYARFSNQLTLSINISGEIFGFINDEKIDSNLENISPTPSGKIGFLSFGKNRSGVYFNTPLVQLSETKIKTMIVCKNMRSS